MSTRKNKKKRDAKSVREASLLANGIFYLGIFLLGFFIDMQTTGSLVGMLICFAASIPIMLTTYPRGWNRKLKGFKELTCVSVAIFILILSSTAVFSRDFPHFLGLVGSIGILATLIQPMILWIIHLIKKLTAGPAFVTHSKDDQVKKLLAQGQANIARLDELYAKVTRNKTPISKQFWHIRKVSLQIFEYIAKKPHLAKRVGTLMDYYFPTVFKLLEDYADYNKKRVKSESVEEIIQKIATSFDSVSTAFDRQLDNLYSDKALDLKVDLVVLEKIMQREGLEE